MLRMIQNRAAASAKTYYSQADYYTGQELPGRWGGKGAELLGLQGEVQRAAFEALCDNLHPQTGRQLTPRHDSDRTVGYDFNFHVPKGVSLAYTHNCDECILSAFRESVRETMTELEADMQTRVRRGGKDDERTTGNLVYAEFVHFTSRPVEGVPDPHLHAHCFVFNATFDSTEDRWKAGQFRNLKRDAPYYEAAFHARLAGRLTELGYPIARRGKHWDLAGVSRELTGKFSRRTDQIEELARKKGIADAAQKSELGAKTREKKSDELSLDQLRRLWQERLTSDEQSSLTQLGGTASTPEPAAARNSLDYAMQHCFERQSVIPKRQLLAEALRHGVGQVEVAALHAELHRPELLIRTLDGRELATTREVLAEEQQMLDFARQGRNQAQPLNPHWTISRDWLNTGQRAAVQHLLTKPDRVLSIKGGAGTGKTSLMQEAVEAIQAGGKQVFTFAPSSDASRGVLREEGFADATTVAALLSDQRLQTQVQGQVLWIDEAGLLGSRTLKQVFDLAAARDCRVILSGDWRQHGSVERGAAMRLLEKEAGIRPAIVTEIQRQQGAYRDAVAALARGHTEEGFQRLDDLGWVREISDSSERHATIAAAYADGLTRGEQMLVVCPTHREGEAITAAIRSTLQERKLLGNEEQQFLRLVPRNLTTAERSDPAQLEPGDVLVFTQNTPGHRKGERIVLDAQPQPELLRLAARYQVYRPETLPLAVGDRIRITANGQTADAAHRLNNGAVYTIKGFTPSGDLRIQNGWTVARDFGFLTHGHVVTSHASQGKTVDRVIVAESGVSLAAASQQQFYVSVSRGRKSALVITDDKESLRDAVNRSDPRLAATELVTHYARARLLARQREAARVAAYYLTSSQIPQPEPRVHEPA